MTDFQSTNRNRRSRGSRALREEGFTLIELMIAVAIIAIVAAVALPLYSGYIATSREGVLVNNIASIEIFQEDFQLRTGAYMLVAANAAAINAGIGWLPRTTDGTTYVLSDGGGGSYDVTATDATGVVVCMRYPQKVRC